MIVRQFEKADAAACCNVVNACITSMSHLDTPTRFYLLSKNVPADFYNEIKDDFALVAELHGQIVGVGALHNNDIHGLYVSPDYQGNGIGETLMQALEAEASNRGLEMLQIDSAPDSVDFYEHLGYENHGTAHSQIGYASVDIVKMSKHVTKTAGV